MAAASHTPPLIETARFTDPTDHALAVSGLNQQYRQLGPGRFKGQLDQLVGNGTEIYVESMNLPMQQQGSVASGSQLLGLALGDNKGMLNNEDTSTAVVHLGGGRSFDSHSVTPPRFASLLISDEVYASYEEYLDAPALRSSAALIEISKQDHQQIEKLFEAGLGLLNGDSGSPLTASTQRLLVEQMLDGFFPILARGRKLPRTDLTHWSYRTIVRRCREYVLARRGETVSVLDLCQMLRISRRTLQTSFVETAGIAPNAYLRAVRLAGVRDLLRRTALKECSIADAAAQFGFLHPSKFSAAFQALFGYSPSQVLRC